MIDYASKKRASKSFIRMLCTTGHTDSELNGNTNPKSRQEILKHFGIDSDIVSIKHDTDGSIAYSNVLQIADYVSEGKGVIISVHANILWHDTDIDLNDYHAVTVTSVKKSSMGDVLGFYICDSAIGDTTYYSADKVRKALTGVPMNVTKSIIR